MITPAQATPADVLALVLRPEDAAEVTEGWRERVPAEAVAFKDAQGALVALGGVQFHKDIAVPWLLCSPLVAAHKASAWRHAKRVVENLKDMGVVGNFIPKDSTANRRFVEALGFRILTSPGPGHDFFFLPTNV